MCGAGASATGGDGRGAAGESVRSVRLSSDHQPASYRGLAGELQACGADLAAGGAQGAQAAGETGPVVAGRWLVHPAQATAVGITSGPTTS